MKKNVYIYIYNICKKGEEIFFSEKLEKESEEKKFYKFIWLRGKENNFLRFYK